MQQGNQAMTLSHLGLITDILGAIYIILVASSIAPPRLLDPFWQANLIGSLVGFAIYPLIGLCLLHLLDQLANPTRTIITKKLLWSRIAVAASLGFFLLVPLQLFVLWSQVDTADNQRQAAISRSELLLQSAIKIVDQARSSDEVLSAIQRFQIPLPPANYRDLPLSRLKQKLKQDFRRAGQTIKSLPYDPGARAQASLQSSTISATRSILLSLAYGLGFAALSQRNAKAMSLLTEVRLACNHFIHRSTAKRSNLRGQHNTIAQYLKSISQDEVS